MKKFLITVLAVIMAASMIFGLAACDNTETEEKVDLKVGAIMVGNESEGYTKAHMDGIDAAVAKLKNDGYNVKVSYKKDIGENETCTAAIKEYASQGYNVVLTNSYGHQFYYDDAYTTYPNTTFVAMTGDLAAATGAANYKNAFTKVFQSRYVSGIVAGYKLQEMINEGKLTAANYDGDNIKIGYVGAYNYDEVVSGYTAFYLGMKSVVSNIVMTVQYTNSWFSIDRENETAKALIAQGCAIIGQHADSEGAPQACEEARNNGTEVYSVGYNVDMKGAAPTAALTSSTNTWSVYYYYLFSKDIKGETIATNWAEGYNQDAVAITPINNAAFSDNGVAVNAAVNTAIAAIKAGTLKVFNCANFTKAGQHLTTYVDNSDFGFKKEIISNDNGVYYVDESVQRSAPYFSIRIDGITEVASSYED